MEGKSKIVGTYFMDGMLQGRVPDAPDFEKCVNQWLASQRKHGLEFDFAVDGGNFNVLAGDMPGQSAKFLPDGLQRHLAGAFQELVEFVPPQDRMQLMSTLRSIEYRPRTEVQTLYVVAPPGRIDVKARFVDAETVAPPPQLTAVGRVKLGCIGLAAALCVLLVSSFFIDWKSWIFDRAEEFIPLKLDEIALDSATFEGFIAFEKRAIDKKRRGLVLLAKAGPDWEAAVTSTAPDTSSWKRFLAIAAIKKGYFRCDMFDDKDQFIASAIIFLGPLIKSQKNQAEFLIPLPDKKVHRIVIESS